MGDRIWKMTHALNPALVPIDVPFDMPAPPAGVEFDKSLLETPVTKITKLANGVQVASEDGGGLISSVAVFVDAGSRLEGSEYMGCTHFMQHLAFKSTASRSHLRLVRDLENIGANTSAMSSRENIMYAGEVLKSNTGPLMEILADTVLEPLVPDEEIDLCRAQIQHELGELENNPQALVLEAVQTAAYSGRTLGAPLLCPPRSLQTVDADTVLDFHASYFTPGRIVISGTGIAHDELVALAEANFGAREAGAPSAPAPKAVYTGGEFRFGGDADTDMVTLAVGLQGVSWSDADLIPACVLHSLMGGGGSFSAGGPGKGMHSRLYRQVLNRYHWVQSATAFNMCYNDSGIFGIHGQCEASQASDLVSVFVDQLQGMAGTLEAEDVMRAKNATKSAVLMNLEQRIIASEDIGRQVMAYGKRQPTPQVCAEIDKVSAADLQRVAKKMLASPVSISAHGNPFYLPRYDDVASKFK
jgi:processing peptidase subunit alpha